MKRTQYILIDDESSPVRDLSRVKKNLPQVFIFTGGAQPDPPKKLRKQIDELADTVRVIQTKITAKNALDFVLTFELGLLAAEDPNGYFHIIAKDKGYDAVVRRMRKQTLLAARHETLNDVPALMTTEERLERLQRDLSTPGKQRPITHVALGSLIQRMFNNSLTSDVVEKAIRYLESRKILGISNEGDITYPS